MRENTSQVILIAAGILVSSLFGVFLYREIFPEYKIYQEDYAALETFRSSYTHEPPPPFKFGIKQIVIEREDKGPAQVDRCISCHVALQIPYFSPTKIAIDLNGNIVRDMQGHPLQIPNDDYIWQKLDDKIAELRDEKILTHLKDQGDSEEIKRRLSQAEFYESLKVAHVGNQSYDVTKVLKMHPLMGNETRPFEYHPIEAFSCTSCHSGNGRGLVTDKAHGPVFDNQYEVEELGHVKIFTEPDLQNDPLFSKIFNHKPGAQLLFQTEPILIGSLIQAKCMQCHLTSKSQINEVSENTENLAKKRQQNLIILEKAFQNEKTTLLDLFKLQQLVQQKGLTQTINELKKSQADYTLSPFEIEHLSSQIHYLEQTLKNENEQKAQIAILAKINADLVTLLGNDKLVQEMEKEYRAKGPEALNTFLKKHQKNPAATGSLFVRGKFLELNQDLLEHARDVETSFQTALFDHETMNALQSDVDELTRNFKRGEDLYISQACYACHRISGLSRGGIGPELTYAGNLYPWYLKRKMVWPQGDLPTSTMPNMHLDHRELEDLMTFLLAQKGGTKAISDTAYLRNLQNWEAGRKMSWEKPISPSQMYDLQFSMTVFATEGCAACHRLQGFDSKVGFTIEKESPTDKQLYDQKQWFQNLFPEVVSFETFDEELPGSMISEKIDQHSKEIDERISDDIRENGLLEDINSKYPEVIESMYSPFRYASRSKDYFFKNLLSKTEDPLEKIKLQKEWKNWKERVHRVFMMYIQIYGFGRLIGPHLNWTGIYRTDEWLMEHFRNPSGHVPRSIMPVFPFDDTKFYALTHMLNELAIRNRKQLRSEWDIHGFHPSEAYEMLCSQCHGVSRYGNGVIAEWIYPIPKNLHNSEFLRNLTKEKAIYSIRNGIHGTPMPPWGEAALHKPSSIQEQSQGIPILKEEEIHYLVEWLFSSLSGGEVIRETKDVPKWEYNPEDVLEELEKEGGSLRPAELSFNLNRFTPMSFASLLAVNNFKGKDKRMSVEDIFDVVPTPSDAGPNSYYIKKKYYTPENIEEGKKFFLINCAYCHGSEGDGTGIRSVVMQESKPRMLTNLDWIRSRDDLRLLRSIKFGIPGTSMTPWGDFTSSLQRLQLVIFIRSLTEEKNNRDLLAETLYNVYENAFILIEEARIEINLKIDQLRLEKQILKKEEKKRKLQIKKGHDPNEKDLSLYRQHLDIKHQISLLHRLDKKLAELKSLVKQEKELYFNLGVSLISKNLNQEILENYLNMIKLNENRYSLIKQKLEVNHDEKIDKKIRDHSKKIVEEFNEILLNLENNKKFIEGKIISPEKRKELEENEASIESITNLRNKLIHDSEEAIRLANKQEEMVKNL